MFRWGSRRGRGCYNVNSSGIMFTSRCSSHTVGRRWWGGRATPPHHSSGPSCFTIVLSCTASSDPQRRLHCFFSSGARMVTPSVSETGSAIRIIASTMKGGAPPAGGGAYEFTSAFTCPSCGFSGRLSAEGIQRGFSSTSVSITALKLCRSRLPAEVRRNVLSAENALENNQAVVNI